MEITESTDLENTETLLSERNPDEVKKGLLAEYSSQIKERKHLQILEVLGSRNGVMFIDEIIAQAWKDEKRVPDVIRGNAVMRNLIGQVNRINANRRMGALKDPSLANRINLEVVKTAQNQYKLTQVRQVNGEA